MDKFEELSKRIQVIEDTEAIKQLMYTYADICDDNHNPERINSVFTEDALWEGGGDLGVFEGHDQIKAAFEDFSTAIDFSRHHLNSPIIEINDHKASAKWYMIGVFDKDGDESISTVTYTGEYIKEDGEWLISHLKPTPTHEINI